MRSTTKDQLWWLARRVGKTYRAHLAMAKRLQRRDRYWTFALVCLSATSTLSAVALLAEPAVYGARGAVLWALMGVGTLAVSLVLANADYKTRSEDAVRAYRQLHRLWTDLDRDAQTFQRKGRRAKVALEGDDRYQVLLDSMPNHSQADYYSSVQLFVEGQRGFDKENPAHEKTSPWRFLVARGQQIASAVGTLVPVIVAGLSFLALMPIVTFVLHG